MLATWSRACGLRPWCPRAGSSRTVAAPLRNGAFSVLPPVSRVKRPMLRSGLRDLAGRSRPRAASLLVLPLPLRPEVRLPRAHEDVEPGQERAPVGVLVGAHVVVVVPGDVPLGPLGVQVRPLVGPVRQDGVGPGGRGEE